MGPSGPLGQYSLETSNASSVEKDVECKCNNIPAANTLLVETYTSVKRTLIRMRLDRLQSTATTMLDRLQNRFEHKRQVTEEEVLPGILIPRKLKKSWTLGVVARCDAI